MNIKIAIRVDTNKEIATGHVMRCMSVAGELKKAGADVVIISADDGVCPFAGPELRVFVLDSDWRDMESELPHLLEFLKTEGIGKMLVDSYQVTTAYFEALADAGIEVAYLDDLCEEAYPVRTVINYRPDADREEYERLYGGFAQMPKFCLGAQYAPLREQFGQAGSTGDPETDKASKDILVTTGGSDNLGISEKIIRRILGENRIIHLLAGRYYAPSNYILDEIEKGTVILHQNVSNVADIMKQCMAAVSSAGSTLLELCAVGVPAVTFTLADNQIPNACYFTNAGIMPYAGDFRENADNCINNIATYLKEIINMSDEDRTDRVFKLHSVTDGRGAARIAGILTGSISV